MSVKISKDVSAGDQQGSYVDVSISGGSVNVWSACETRPRGTTEREVKLKLQIQPDFPIVIGRQEGGEIEYLDPAYSPTPVVPFSRRTILTAKQADQGVSRGHLMLKSSPLGIVVVNGVPRRGGGIRAPLNGTMLLEPVHRRMEPAEEYLVDKGAAAKISLPNGTVILLVPE